MTQLPADPSAGRPPAPTGTIRLTIQGNQLTSNFIVPAVRLNGYPMASRYGAQDLTVWAGRNHLDLDAQWMRTYGQAAIDVDVAPGQVVEVWYAAPVHQFARGAIGLTRQRRPGAWLLWLLLGLLVLGLVAGVVASAVGR